MISIVALTVGVLFFWLFNIFLLKRSISNTFRYVISYLATFVLHTGTLYIIATSKEFLDPLELITYSIIATLAVNTIILVIIHSELMRTRIDRAESENQDLKVANLEAQKRVLMQQFQPHFLFNALSTLKSLIRENQDQAEDYSVKLSEFLRYSINIQSNELVSLKEEMQFASDYIDLQKMRFGNALNCRFKVSDESLKLKLPAFALQTLLENAIKHNSFTEKRPLNISIVSENNKLKVSNNISPKPLVPVLGTGLKNLSERYRMISNSAIEIQANENEFTVYLNLIEL